MQSSLGLNAVARFSPVGLHTGAVQRLQTFGLRVPIAVAVSAGNDPDLRFERREPILIGTVGASMVVHLVKLDLADVRGH